VKKSSKSSAAAALRHQASLRERKWRLRNGIAFLNALSCWRIIISSRHMKIGEQRLIGVCNSDIIATEHQQRNSSARNAPRTPAPRTTLSGTLAAERHRCGG